MPGAFSVATMAGNDSIGLLFFRGDDCCGSSLGRLAAGTVSAHHTMTPCWCNSSSTSSSRERSARSTSSVCSANHGTLLHRTVGNARHPDRVVREDDRLGHPVGTRHLDQHVPGQKMGVAHDFFVAETRPGGQPGVSELLATLELRLVGGPLLDGRADDGVNRVVPTLPVRQRRVGDPLGMADQAGQRRRTAAPARPAG